MGKTRQLPGPGIRHLRIIMYTISNLLWLKKHFLNKMSGKSLLPSPEKGLPTPEIYSADARATD